MNEQNGFLDVAKLIDETQFSFPLPLRGETIMLRKVHQQELAMLVAHGSIAEYEGQHDFSARVLVIASVRPRLLFEAALCLGSDALHAATAVLRFSGLVKEEEAESRIEAVGAP